MVYATLLQILRNVGKLRSNSASGWRFPSPIAVIRSLTGTGEPATDFAFVSLANYDHWRHTVLGHRELARKLRIASFAQEYGIGLCGYLAIAKNCDSNGIDAIRASVRVPDGGVIKDESDDFDANASVRRDKTSSPEQASAVWSVSRSRVVGRRGFWRRRHPNRRWALAVASAFCRDIARCADIAA
jgi:hypothetical protein